MSPFDLLQIDPVRAIALQAGDAILAARAHGLHTITKPDGSPQTNADRDAEAVIVAGLRALTPAIPVVAEESAALTDRPDPDRPYWLVDPLDGTKSFVAGDDDFSVNIGLIFKGRPAFGVIYAPALDEMFWNDDHQAWRRNAQGLIEPIHTRSQPETGLTLITSRRNRPPGVRLRTILQNHKIAEELMASGAIKYGYLAMGRADLYPRLSPTMEWDNAAGEAILHAAGGRVTDLNGQLLRYGQPDLTHQGILATSGLQCIPNLSVPSPTE